MSALKSQDIVVVLKLISLQQTDDCQRSGEAPVSVRGLAKMLGISKSEISASIKRSLFSGLAITDRDSKQPTAHRRNLYNLIVHGLKFVFPVHSGAMVRGIPTAFAAPMLKDQLLRASDFIHVWPSADGRDLGQSVAPLFDSVPLAAQLDDRLYEYLALCDAIRLGSPREAGLAAERLGERMFE